MASGYVLPDRLDAFEDESFNGLAMRYAEIYAFHDPRDIFFRLQPRRSYLESYARLDPDTEEGEAVRQLMHVPPNAIRRLSAWYPDHMSVRVHGHELAVDLTDFSLRQSCPACLREHTYHRAIWLIAAMPVCAQHGTPLLRACPECHAPLRWRGRGVHRCGKPGCGFDLRNALQEPLSTDVVSGVRALAELFKGERHASGLGFADALHASLLLGAARDGRPLRGRAARMIGEHQANLPHLLTLGWQVLDPWPGPFRSFLVEQVQSEGNGPAVGVRRSLGWFGKLLTSAKKYPWLAALRRETAAYLATQPAVVVKPTVLRSWGLGESGDNTPLSLSEAARVAGVSMTALRQTATRLGVDLGPATSRNAPRRVSPELLKRLSSGCAAHSSISATEAGRILGLPARSVMQLARAGFLSEIPAVQRASIQRCLQRADVETLLGRFENTVGALPSVASPGPDHMKFGAGLKHDGYGVVFLTRAVLSGSMRPTAIWSNRQGLGRYLFARLPSRSTRGRGQIRPSTEVKSRSST